MLEVILEHLLSQWQFQNHQQNQPSKASQTRTKRITKEEEADEWLIKSQKERPLLFTVLDQ